MAQDKDKITWINGRVDGVIISIRSDLWQALVEDGAVTGIGFTGTGAGETPAISFSLDPEKSELLREVMEKHEGFRYLAKNKNAPPREQT